MGNTECKNCINLEKELFAEIILGKNEINSNNLPITTNNKFNKIQDEIPHEIKQKNFSQNNKFNEDEGKKNEKEYEENINDFNKNLNEIINENNKQDSNNNGLKYEVEYELNDLKNQRMSDSNEEEYENSEEEK